MGRPRTRRVDGHGAGADGRLRSESYVGSVHERPENIHERRHRCVSALGNRLAPRPQHCWRAGFQRHIARRLPLGVYCDTTHGTDPFTNLPDQNMPSVKEQSYTGKQGREMDFALNYGASVYHGINLGAGRAVVLHPGAESEIPHAWVFDLRTSIKF